ncbi:MAG TPA: hypothetical protein VNW15_12820 [Rhizomicrobium sp.]|nr:hypothetical protein [Rhizomicrobium sp.]
MLAYVLAVSQSNPLIGTLKAPNLPQTQAPSSTPASKGGEWDFSFHNLLSIINPLQHVPVIGTLYRALTGDTIGTPEKIAGDTLYGGLWGALASIADTAFEAITGKNVGDTVLALFSGKHSDPPVAVASVAAPSPAPADIGLYTLAASLNQKGVENDIAQRALLAYKKTMALPDLALPSPVLGAGF